MTIVGIIANPAAGKDIRRLVSHATSFDNHQKVNIVRRVLLGLEAAGVDEVVIMPDSFGIGERALDGLPLRLQTRLLEMPVEFSQADSTRAAELMRERGARSLVTLGGDGTNRAVAKGCGAVPLMPISTGTNNVFPYMIEGTVAGLAAGVVARGVVDSRQVTRPTPRLEVLRAASLVDIALIDVVVHRGQFVGSRAIWETDDILQIVLSRVEPHGIGFSSIGGRLAASSPHGARGLAIETGGDDLQVLAPIAPGLIRWVPVAAYRTLEAGDVVDIAHAPAVLALDGEREVITRPGDPMQIRMTADGPRVIDYQAALRLATETGLFVRRGPSPAGS